MIDSFFKYLKENSPVSQRLYYDEKDADYKEYARFSKIVLPPPLPLSEQLQDVLLKRLSTRDFSSKPLSFSEISSLLFWSAGIVSDRQLDGNATRAHPSGGAKYPIEIYPVVLNGDNIQKGVYHYNVKKHVLEELKYVNVREVLNCFEGYAFIPDAGILLLFSFIKSRSVPKYGGLAYKLGLLEGGHIGQNIYLVSTALGLGCCAVGDYDEEGLHQLLHLDGVNESLFYTLAIGNKERP